MSNNEKQKRKKKTDFTKTREIEVIQEGHTKSVVIEINETFKNATGVELVLETSKYVCIGVFMGSSDAIPGYSGATTLALLGYFKTLMLLARSIFIPEKGITRLRAFILLMPFAVGWLLGIFGFAHLTEWMSIHGMGLELMFFFSAFVLVSTPIFLLREKPGLIQRQEGKRLKVKFSTKWLWFLVGFVTILTSAIVVLVVKGGFDVNHDGKNNHLGTHYKLGNLGWLSLLGIAMLAGAVTLIPGGSGAIIQLLGSKYDKIHWIMLTHVEENIAGLAIYTLATFTGMILTVFLIGWWLKRHQRSLAAFSFGMLLASVPAILLVPNPSSWAVLANGWHHIVGVVIAALSGLGAGITVYLLAKHASAKRKMAKIKTAKQNAS